MRKLDVSNNNSREYKVRAILNSIVYTRKLKSGNLLELYYLVSLKEYLKEENTEKPILTIQLFKKLISSFYKNYLNKSIAIFRTINIAPLMAKQIIKPTALK